MSLSKKILEFFDEHICAKIEKVKVIVDLIGRSMSYLDGPFFKKHFTEFVRAHLEYGQVMLGSDLQKKNQKQKQKQKKQNKSISMHLKTYSVALLNLWMDMKF